jgi:hypothetical protein
MTKVMTPRTDSKYPTTPAEERYDNNYTKFTFYCRDDLKQFWDEVSTWKGSRANVGNIGLAMFQAAYENDLEEMAKLVQLAQKFKRQNNELHKKF